MTGGGGPAPPHPAGQEPDQRCRCDLPPISRCCGPACPFPSSSSVRPLQLELARENVAWPADQAAVAGCQVMIEALNPMDNSPCLLTTTAGAAAFARQTGRDNVRLQYDVYHMQRVEGEITGTLDIYWDLISHIQIAGVPGRGEPGTGEINYPFVLGHLERRGYARARSAG